MSNNKMSLRFLLFYILFDISVLSSGIIGDAAAASGISYTTNPVTYALGQTIAYNKASCAGTLSNVSVSPAFPDGLTLHSTTGTILGLPTQIVKGTAYTVSGLCNAAPVTGILTLAIGDAKTAYYVDDVNGNDSADGHTPATAWKSLTKVNHAALGPNTSVRFKRGGVWRGQLVMQSGSSAGGLYYDAYGTGPLPVLMGSVSADNPAGWTPDFFMNWAPSGTGGWTKVAGNIWKSNAVFAPLSGRPNGQPYNSANDVGNIIYKPTPTTIATGVEGMTGSPSAGTGRLTNSTSVLTSPAMWLFNTNDYHVYVYSTSNPATAFPGLELAIDGDIVSIFRASYAYLQHFALRYGAACAINGASSSYLTFRDLEISYNGGGNLGGSGTRYGNGIQFWGNAHDNLVERNRIWQIYDTGFTNQSTGSMIDQHNITYRNNIIWNVPNDCIEFWIYPSDTLSTMHDIYVYNNTCVSPSGWAVGQRPNGNQQTGMDFGSPASVTVSNIVIKNNVFANFPGNAIVEYQSFSLWKGLMVVDYNDWYNSLSRANVHQWQPTSLDESLLVWGVNLPAEQHGIEVDPVFVNLGTGDFHEGTRSPLINAGANLTAKGVVLDFDRNPRPATGAFDIGAFQHVAAP